MDTSGFYPQLGNNDPLFEIADYTQLLKQKLDSGQTAPVITTDTNWSYLGGLYIQPSALKTRVNLNLLITRTGGSFGLTTTPIQALSLIPLEYRPAGYSLTRYTVLQTSTGTDAWGMYVRIDKDGNLFLRTDVGTTTVATGSKIELDMTWLLP
jgi:hypothetical protein